MTGRHDRPLRLDYGVDGAPYLAGLGAAAGALTSLGLLALARAGRSARPGSLRSLGAAAVALGVAAVVPTVLGLRYVTSGKLALRDRVLGSVDWSGDEVVVDVGAGRGLLAIGAAHRTSGPVHCVDLFVSKDLSGNTPGRLAQNAEREGVLHRIVVHNEDARTMPLPDGCADVVVSTLCLHNIAEASGRAAALDQIVRVLAPGGTVVLSDLAHVRNEYAPHLTASGLQIRSVAAARGTFPPQQVLVAAKPLREE